MRELLQKLSWWDKALVFLVAVYLLLWPAEPFSQFVLQIRILLQMTIYVIGSIVLVRFAVRGTEVLIRRFLWRVRRRMVAVYLFVGFIPLTLAITLAGLGLILLFGPVAAYMVTAKIEQRAGALQAAASSFGWELRATEPGQRREAARRFIEDASERFPGIMLRVETARGPAGFPPELVAKQPPEAIQQFQGVVRLEDRLYLAGHAQYSPEARSVLLMVPLTGEYLADLLPGLGVVERMSFSTSTQTPPGAGVESEAAVSPSRFRTEERIPDVPGEHAPTSDAPNNSEEAGLRQRIQAAQARLQTARERIPPASNAFDWEVRWPVQVPVLSWESGESRLETAFALISRYSAIVGLLFSGQSLEIERGVRIFAYILVGLFFATVVISMVVALSLTRTMTRTVDAIYVGTQRVNEGDFSYRVPLRGNDQLSELGRSFNAMTESIEQLIEESRERQRLQAELEIAREVQTQLFPRARPRLKTLDVLGVCRPAQVVSGDFYDYVELSPTRLALAFGDISGKGISAALVMATLHSIVRTQLSLLTQTDGDLTVTAAELVSRANGQLYEGTSADKFATLFFATYDQQLDRLSYCNAGHLPPLLIRNGKVQRLEVTGIVAGVVPQSSYESRTLQLEPGDLLVAYTDGVTEPENAYGQEFGEERMIEALIRHADRPIEQIIEAVMQEAVQWTDKLTLQDDMTMLVARRSA